MIKVEINPARIERIVLESRSEMERDFDDATYRFIRPLLDRLDRRLRSVARSAIAELPTAAGGGRVKKSNRLPERGTHGGAL
jgi:hypothetical protein